MSLPVHLQEKPVHVQAGRSGTYAVSGASGTRVTILQVKLMPGIGVPAIISAAGDAEAGADGNIEFEWWLNGSPLVGWSDYRQISRFGVLGDWQASRIDDPQELTPGGLLELKVYKKDAIAYECEGECRVGYYRSERD